MKTTTYMVLAVLVGPACGTQDGGDDRSGEENNERVPTTPPWGTGGGGETPPRDDIFRDVTVSSGLLWDSDANPVMISAGGAFFDANGDGWLDIAIGSEGGGLGLFFGAAGGHFSDVTGYAGLTISTNPIVTGVSTADYDGDGDIDLFVTRHGSNLLFRNDGHGRFADVTDTAGIPANEYWSAAGAFGDYDGDGDLDLFIGNYIEVIDFPFHTADPNVLLENQGDGTFTDVTELMGVAGDGTTLAATWTDFDNDGSPELFVCNDFGQTVERNQVFRYTGTSFEDITVSLGLDLEMYCMSIASGDVDRDGDFDYYFSNLGRNAMMFREGDTFTDRTDETDTALFRVPKDNKLLSSWSSGFHDFDNDGWLDLFVVNGYVPAASDIHNTRRAPNAILMQRDGVFEDFAAGTPLADEGFGRGGAFADYDQDGDMDVLVVNLEGVQLLENVMEQGNWIEFDLHDRGGNPRGLGARVELTLSDGLTLVREVSRQYGFASSSSPTVHFGLGDADHASLVRVTWPDGASQELFNLLGNQRYRLDRPTTSSFSAPR